MVVAVFVHWASGGATTAPAAIRVEAIDGTTWEPLQANTCKARVLVFILQDCPICNGYAPELSRLAEEFGARGLSLMLVQVDSTLSVEEAKKHAKEYRYQMPVLMDREHQLVKALKIATAPTALVLGADGTVRYKGRIDDRYAGLGKPRTVATTQELRDAITATLEGKGVEKAEVASVGCAVPDLAEKKK